MIERLITLSTLLVCADILLQHIDHPGATQGAAAIGCLIGGILLFRDPPD